MRKLTLALLTLSLPFTAILHADPVAILGPAPGALQGAPGDTVGWGFFISSDPGLWISFTQVVPVNETDPALGVFLDTLGPQGGPVNAVLPPGAPAWTEDFDANTMQGVGSYTISASALPGDQDSGDLRFFYDTFTGDPNTCGDCYVDSRVLDAPFSVTVSSSQSPVPEPNSVMMMLLPVGLILLRRRSRVTRAAMRSLE